MRICLLMLIVMGTLTGQAVPPPPGPPPPPTWSATPPNARSATFEVATIKRSKSVTAFGGGAQPGPGRLTITNQSLEAMLQMAYGRDVKVDGLPEWARTERFDVAAKAYETPDSSQLMLALKALLLERFKIAAHMETREVPIFILKVDGKSAKVKPSRGTKDPAAPQLTGSSRHLSGRHASMEQLVRTLSHPLGRPVVDRTGLTGEYDFDANWSPEEYPGGGALLTALREQLGLRLESSRGPAQVLMIDKVQRIPVEN